MDIYKKKYEDALERAKKIVNNEYASLIWKDWLKNTFPELKKSEDERIRKGLIKAVSRTFEGNKLYGTDVTREEALAWLEKKGRQKPVVIIPKFRIGDNIKTTNEEPLTITKIDDKGYWSEDLLICNFDDAAKWELVEQKPVQETESFEAEHGKYYYCIKDYFCGGRKQASKGDVIQALRGLPIMGLKDASEYFLPLNSIKYNSVWSKEDECYMTECINAIATKDGWSFEEKRKTKRWLESIKERIRG